MKKSALLVLSTVLSSVSVRAVYVTQGQVYCQAPCDPLSNVQQCQRGCLCYPRRDKPRLGNCFNPNAHIPPNHKHPRDIPPLPSRVGLPGALPPTAAPITPRPRPILGISGSTRQHPRTPAQGSSGGHTVSSLPGSPLNRPLPPIPDPSEESARPETPNWPRGRPLPPVPHNPEVRRQPASPRLPETLKMHPRA
uniref:Putative was/wasl-interacting protein family member 1 n=1 Tax=Amblyomma triste TaxID=251400 RepID=A0A023G5A2_AMBTT